MSTEQRNIEALIQLAGGGWLYFHDPVRVIEARTPDAVARALIEVDGAVRQDARYAVGFVTYEAAAAFGLAVHPAWNDQGLPLVWFGLFGVDQVVQLADLPTTSESYELGPLTASVDRPAFDAAFARIKDHLAAGDTYQANYTFRLAASFRGDARSLFADLATAQGGRHGAFIALDSHSICSASPELFFERTGTRLSARPMKGTAARGRTVEDDRQRRQELQDSAKDQAENVMIVDMVRNDLGRVASVGSVQVPTLFEVERYPGLWQMTSSVTACSSAPLVDLFAALHPSASVTGAPKVRTMAILGDLERGPRGVYTGAIGYVGPGGSCHFSVAIRTAVVDHRAQTLEFGVGSGIVWDSDAEAEHRECLLKGSVLGKRPVAFDLLETLRWGPAEGFRLLERHVARMRESAEYFEFDFDEGGVRAELLRLSDILRAGDSPVRVRLLLSRQGAIRVEHRPLEASGPVTVVIASGAVDQDDVFLFHKTTNRGVYERARSGGVEVILWNARGEVTEATTANVVIEMDGTLVTPPVACGLLAGTLRAEILARGEVRESIVTLDQLQQADKIWLVNSVHGWREARLVSREQR